MSTPLLLPLVPDKLRTRTWTRRGVLTSACGTVCEALTANYLMTTSSFKAHISPSFPPISIGYLFKVSKVVNFSSKQKVRWNIIKLCKYCLFTRQFSARPLPIHVYHVACSSHSSFFSCTYVIIFVCLVLAERQEPK